MVHPGSVLQRYKPHVGWKSVFKHACPTNRTTASVAKPYFDEPGCIIHVDTYYTIPVVVTAVFLKMSPRV
jgi:hypothetical protein